MSSIDQVKRDYQSLLEKEESTPFLIAIDSIVNGPRFTTREFMLRSLKELEYGGKNNRRRKGRAL